MEKVFRKSLGTSKILVVMLCGLILIGNLSCSSDASDSGNSSTGPKNGSISGKVTFSNVEENANSGIIVTLDKTDGLSTTAVTKSVASRSIVSGARSLVSSTVTENDGSYKFNNLEAGTYTIYAASSYSSEKAVFTNVVVRSAETTIAESLKLVATGSMTGTITLDGTTTGNTGFLVFVAGTSFMAMTDDSGNYTISGVPAGKGYQVVATKGNALHSLSSNVTVTANESTAMTDNNFTTDELKVGLGMVWLGSFASSDEIENPSYLNAYFNTTNGCSYIYTGTGWTLLARSGANGADGKDGIGSVSGLTANYSNATQKITVTWTNPTGKNLDYILLSYTKDGTAVVTDSHATSPYVLSDVEVDGSEYVFSVKAVDSFGNASVVQTVSVTPQEGVGVQSITLSRYHFAYNDADQTVTAVATLNNADQIAAGTVVKIQTKDPAGNVTNTVATLDKNAGTATAKITAPSTSASESGTTYTVLCKIGNEAADSTHTARFNVSATATLSDLNFHSDKVQIPLSSVTSITTETLRIWGYNLDLTRPSIQLYDSTGAAYFTQPIAVDTSEVLWTAESGENYQTIDTEIPVPTTDDSYTVRVLFGGVVQSSYTRTLQVYDVPKFTSFTIPLVSVSKEDCTVTAKIIGKNFDTPDVDLSDFNATCSTGSIVTTTSFTRKSDSVLNATFTIPGTVGEYTVTVSYGLNSVKGTLKAQNFSTYHIGDVLLSDGTVIPYNVENLTFTDEQKAVAVGVMYGFNEYGAPAGWLGLYNSAAGTNSGYYQWSKNGNTGFNTMFTDIVCAPNGNADTAIFTGDTDGSDNWAYICSIDPDGTANAAENYPAFDYVNNYARNFGLTGNYATGWYMPSIAELCYIYRSKNILNAVLDALEGIKMYSGLFWSSSQYIFNRDFILELHFPDGDIYGNSKDCKISVCCVRAFK